MDYYTQLQMHMIASQSELQAMYAHMLSKNVIIDTKPEFGKFSHALRLQLFCGMQLSVSRCRAFEANSRNVPWEIAIVDPESTENTGIIIDKHALFPTESIIMDPMVKPVGKGVDDYDALESEIRRINDYYTQHPRKPDPEIMNIVQ